MTSAESDIHYSNVLSVLREMRHVSGAIYKNSLWHQEVHVCYFHIFERFFLNNFQNSGLHSIIYQWSNPAGIVTWKAPFMSILFRKHRISETLNLVLQSWIPINISNLWPSLESPLYPNFQVCNL